MVDSKGDDCFFSLLLVRDHNSSEHRITAIRMGRATPTLHRRSVMLCKYGGNPLCSQMGGKTANFSCVMSVNDHTQSRCRAPKLVEDDSRNWMSAGRWHSFSCPRTAAVCCYIMIALLTKLWNWCHQKPPLPRCVCSLVFVDRFLLLLLFVFSIFSKLCSPFHLTLRHFGCGNNWNQYEPRVIKSLSSCG